MRKLFFAVSALALLSGCSMMPPIPDAPTYKPDAIAQLQVGVTTEAQAQALFGEPQRVELTHGETIVGYSHIQRLSQPANRREMLAIKFGHDGKLVSYTLNTTVDQ